MKTSKSGARVVIRRVVVVGTIAGAVVAGAIAVDRARPDEDAVVAPDPLTVATAERTDLSADATLEGTVQSTSSLTVLHRIEGATPSTASGSSPDQSATGATPTNGAPAQGVAFVQLEPVAFFAAAASGSSDDDTTTVPDGTVASTTTIPITTVPDTTASTTTIPGTTAPDTTASTTTIPGTTAPDTTASTTTIPGTTAPDTTAPTTTIPGTTAPDTTTPIDSTVAGGPRGGGGAFPSGVSGGTGAATGSSGSGTTTASITERVTSLPAVGQTIELGDVLYTVDGRPVVALAGPLPAWRSLSTSSADGPDIAQLELSLAGLGYDADGSLVVDNEYDSATAGAVEAWQAGLGLEATGEVELGDVVYLPGTVTVTALDSTIGADVTEADEILEVSGRSQQIVATVTDEAQSVLVPGLGVTVGAAAGAVEGVVTLVRSVAADDGTITVEAAVTPVAEMAGQPDGSAVDVTVDIEGPTDAIAVPAEAVVSRLDGTYAVEVRDGDGDHFVAVEIVSVRGSKVAVSGIGAGTQVLVPA